MHFIPEKNVILITDTYNHKIKVVDPFRNEIFSWLGSGRNNLADETTFKSGFNEPSGVSSLYDEERRDVKVYICDTNNHCIRQTYYDVGSVVTPVIAGIPRCVSGECFPDEEVDEATKQRSINQKKGGEDEGKMNMVPGKVKGTCVPAGEYDSEEEAKENNT